MTSHKDLDAWKDSVDLVILIYQATQGFPKTELFGLTGQIRRASISIPANISEGAARNQTKDFIRFLRIAMGSLSELETLLIISARISLIDADSYNVLTGKIHKINKQLSGLIRSLTAMIHE
jgi:four helix bundle protein